MTPTVGWDAFRITILDEGGDIWLWEVLADAENFFPDEAADQRLVRAETLISELCAEGFAYVVDGVTSARLSDTETRTVIASGRWRTFPPGSAR